ncbi:MAG: N-acetyltransferase [Ilumatobacteraceae bacterium]|nr:N-acetyltransferase [Ilumatobacteraceae bacterium]
MLIRDADDADVPAITTIINALLHTTTYEWTEQVHTEQERTAWLAAHRAAAHPVLVAVADGEVVGWAAYGDFRDTARWPGYWPVVEHSVHVRADQWGRNVGRELMEALIGRARAAGKRAMVGGIDGENARSIRFHERLGFVEVARMPGIGEKFGRRLDLVLVQRAIEPDAAPEAPEA